MRGYFIAFEGANGVGKSTIINKVYNELVNRNIDVFLTKEPSETEMGILSRKIADKISGKALACLVASDRFYHVENIIKVELDNGKIVLCDRNILSAFVFNKMDNISFEYTERIYEGLMYPDAIVLFYANPTLVSERLSQRDILTRYEKEKVGFEQQVINDSVLFMRNKYINIFEISSECSIEETVKQTIDIIIEIIGNKDKE